MKNKTISNSSFRDPGGFIFFREGQPYRQINKMYKEHYDHFINSGLFEKLTKKNLIIPHKEVEDKGVKSEDCYKVIKPEKIPFVSYPYEWSFGQLKDAALITLKIQKLALEYGMILKDSSAYNIQFSAGKPIFIDTLSFKKYTEGAPWAAYRQFCQHFLAPLSLMSYRDARLNQLFRVFLDGPPLDLAASLLPFSARLRPALLAHLYLHGKSQARFGNKAIKKSAYSIKRHSLLALVDNLESAIKKLKWRMPETEWGKYYSHTNYSTEALEFKKQIITNFFNKIKPRMVWDIGANTGLFSRLAAQQGIKTISFDIDCAAVEKNYQECLIKSEKNILPLFLDLTNPSPAIGWDNKERMSLLERGPADTVMALALIHHLAISNNLPLGKIAKFFSKASQSLIIEFIPKTDSNVQKLLSSREDIFPDYTQENFESEFKKYFNIQTAVNIKGSDRVLCLMIRRP